MMEGFGVHTFRLVSRSGKSTLCKFHWKPLLGAHSVVWDEAQKISGKDPDFHRRDLWEAIASGHPAEYELGLQLLGEDELAFGVDLLDSTKLVPEELAPVRLVGRLTLDRNPDNFFAETEQVAFCIGNVVPGIDFTNDPLLQARLFSYLDTQLTRLGGPNFAELPINRPLASVRNHQQDGFHRRAIPTARALYHPNSIANGEPPPAAAGPDAFRHFAQPVDGPKVRRRSESFDDHFTQARLFLHSQSPAERRHLIDACRFELGQVERLAIRRRVIALFREIEEELAREVAQGIGVALEGAPAGPARRRPRNGGDGLESSPALSLERASKATIATRRVAVLVAPGACAAEVAALAEAICGGGAAVEYVSHHLGAVPLDDGTRADATKTFLTASSVLYDAVYVPGGRASADALLSGIEAPGFVGEACDHQKPIAATAEGAELLLASGVLPEADVEALPEGARSAYGVVTAPAGEEQEAARLFVEALAQHRHFDRPPRRPSASPSGSAVASRTDLERPRRRR
jgi:catalase